MYSSFALASIRPWKSRKWRVVSSKDLRIVLRRQKCKLFVAEQKRRAVAEATSQDPLRSEMTAAQGGVSHAQAHRLDNKRMEETPEPASDGHDPSPVCRKRKISASSSVAPFFEPRQKRQCVGSTRRRRASCELSDLPAVWCPGLSLLGTHLLWLRNGDWLSDEHVEAANKLLKKQFPELAGLQPPCLGLAGCFESWSADKGVQILHNGHGHFVTTGFDNGIQSLYDSLDHGLTPSLKSQLAQLSQEALQVSWPHVQRQRGPSACGVFAIAFAVELAFGGDPAQVIYDQSLMRDHLERCYEEEILTPFPRIEGVSPPWGKKASRMVCSR